jgi:ABC-type nitrate/sulfonate/bicarbonate transport system permease component
MIMVYKSELKIPAIYAATLVCCLLGFLFVALVIRARRSALRHWHESAMADPE